MKDRHQPLDPLDPDEPYGTAIADRDHELTDLAAEIGHVLRGATDTAQRSTLTWFLRLWPREQRLIVGAAGTPLDVDAAMARIERRYHLDRP